MINSLFPSDEISHMGQVLSMVCLRRCLSRTSLAESMNMNKSSISPLINELLERGILMEENLGTSGPKGGRRPVILNINKSWGWLLGIAVGGITAEAVAIDCRGVCIAKGIVKRTNSLEKDIRDLCLELMIRVPSGPPLTIGLCGDPNTGIEDIDPAVRFFSVPVLREEYLPCRAWQLLFDGKQEMSGDFLLCHIDQQAMNGKLELSGQICIVLNDRVYHRSRISPIRFRSQVSIKSGIDPILDRIDQFELFERVSSHMIMLMSMFSIDTIYVGGEIGEQILKKNSEFRRYFPRDSFPELNLRTYSLDNETLAFGAACRALWHYFCTMDSPYLQMSS